MASLIITKPEKKTRIYPSLPASKSISTRLAVLKALYPDYIHVDNISDAADVLLMERSIHSMNTCSESSIPLVIDAGNSGAVLRFLTAYASILPGKWLITGSKRLMKRPLAPLVDALKFLQADIEYAGRKGFIPLIVKGKELNGNKVNIDASASSQFVTSLLLIANKLPGDLEIKMNTAVSSRGYIELTTEILKEVGVIIEQSSDGMRLVQSKVKKTFFHVEADWASASFWYEYVCLSPDTEITIKGLNSKSFQPESVLPGLFAMLGVETIFKDGAVLIRKTSKAQNNIRYNFRDNPDLALPFIIATAVSGSAAEISGLDNLKYKESDRMKALLVLLNRIGVHFDTDKKTTIQLKKSSIMLPDTIAFDCQNDHRLIMTAAPLASLLKNGISLENHSEIEKSYPDYWSELKAAGFKLQTAKA